MKTVSVIIIILFCAWSAAAGDKPIIDLSADDGLQIVTDLDDLDQDYYDVQSMPGGGTSVYSYDENKFYDVQSYKDGSVDVQTVGGSEDSWSDFD